MGSAGSFFKSLLTTSLLEERKRTETMPRNGSPSIRESRRAQGSDPTQEPWPRHPTSAPFEWKVGGRKGCSLLISLFNKEERGHTGCRAQRPSPLGHGRGQSRALTGGRYTEWDTDPVPPSAQIWEEKGHQVLRRSS